ncbi:hypothetical protein FXV83_41825 [Bradyrhizobium hipponense]|uniref:Uncharacterized protein n=1 Tax=Bradyrhizobium hipponense TaxID=2605638 RepID=A0A5S4Y9Y5_9BRAD|nr:hypothetical protein [Bradyrhizobium hipponense]TYO60802.1 hypothetical protein FXV83_41825 [Bradyrhizobium hipponense]
MYINWDVTMRFDPNSLVPSTQHGIPVPSYGNYGGVNYSAGQEGGTTPEVGSAAYLAHPPKDDLDQLFYAHDLVYQHLRDGTATVLQTFDADAKLLEGMYTLTQSEPALFANDPEALLYEAFATLGILGKIETTPGESEYLQSTLPQSEEQLLAAAAIHNFDTGLAETPGNESRSLHGAFHVFEAQFGDLLLA